MNFKNLVVCSTFFLISNLVAFQGSLTPAKEYILNIPEPSGIAYHNPSGSLYTHNDGMNSSIYQITASGIVLDTLYIGGQDAGTFVVFDAGQQITDFHVGVTVSRFFNFSALAHQGIDFVKEQDHLAAMGRVKQPPDVFFRLTDILAHQPCQIDTIQRPAQICGQHGGRKRFPGSGRPAEQRHRAADRLAAPLIDHRFAMVQPE